MEHPGRLNTTASLQENIQNYLHGCKELGLPESSLFNTIDLFEEKNVNMVGAFSFFFVCCSRFIIHLQATIDRDV
jgi:hypothetical protein